MMRLMEAYEKFNKMRNMEYSLLFFLTIEMIVAGIGFFSMDTVGTSIIIEWFFIIWITNLCAASLVLMVFNPLIFAIYRVGFRIIYMSVILYIFWSIHQLVVSPYFIAFAFLELAYLLVGITKYNIPYPGQWIVKLNDIWQGSQDTMMIENARESSIPICDFDMDVKDTFDDEFTDDLFDYYTAFEDSVSPSYFSFQRHRGNRII